MIIMRDEDMLEVTEIYGSDNGESKPKKRSKSLDQGLNIDYKEVIMKKTQMIGYNYDDRRMTAKMSEVKVRG